MNERMPRIKPSPFISGVTPYRPPRAMTPVDLHLDGNEGRPPSPKILEELSRTDTELLRRYPDPRALEIMISARIGISPERVVVTAGADDALARVCRSMLAPGREMILPVPTFGMIERYARLAGGAVVEVPWLEGAFPVDRVLERVTANTALIAVVTPNSPTGLTATIEDVVRLSDAAPDALVMIDLAYTEFADEDPTEALLALPNTVITRTLSKAWGLAGLRVGWAAGTEQVVEWLRASGHPYAISSVSLSLAAARLDGGDADIGKNIAQVRKERRLLRELLTSLDVKTLPSQANFVFGRLRDASWMRDGLAGMGIGVRIFPGKPHLEDAVRITVPGDDEEYRRLSRGIETVLVPQAIFLDVDDTLADVSESYRRATCSTAEAFGADVTFEDITAAKAAGDANNDWELTHRMILERGKEASLEDVTAKFEELYQGVGETPGYRKKETLLCTRELLVELAGRVKLAVVTGRPRRDAEVFLKEQGIRDLFGAVITMDDGPLKPDPTPCRMALEALGVKRAWMVGDTPDDMRSARGAGVLPLGVIAPADDPSIATDALIQSGAGRVLGSLDDLKELLP